MISKTRTSSRRHISTSSVLLILNQNIVLIVNSIAAELGTAFDVTTSEWKIYTTGIKSLLDCKKEENSYDSFPSADCGS